MKKSKLREQYNDFLVTAQESSIAELNRQMSTFNKTISDIDLAQEADMTLKMAKNHVRKILDRYSLPRKDLKIKSRFVNEIIKEKSNETAPDIEMVDDIFYDRKD